MAGKRPAQRTLEFFRKKGAAPVMVERFVYNHKEDFLGCIDLLVMRPHKKTITAVQCFGKDWSVHKKKIIEEHPEGAMFWLGLGHEFYFVGWRKLLVKKGGKQVRWIPRIGEVKLFKGGLYLVELEEDPWRKWGL